MVHPGTEDRDIVLVLGPMPTARRLQLRRLLGHTPGVRIAGQAFSLEQVPPLVRTHHAQALLLSEAADLRALPPLPAGLRTCVLLDGPATVAAPPGLRLRGLDCPPDLEGMGPGDAFITALRRALTGTGDAQAAVGARP